MIYYLLMCRTLTYAQRTARALNRAAITAETRRAPGEVSSNGCGWCVKIPENRLTDGLDILRRNELMPSKIYMMYPDGTLTEVVV